MKWEKGETEYKFIFLRLEGRDRRGIQQNITTNS